MSFTARYHGECVACGEELLGTEVNFDLADKLVHVKCPEQLDDDDKAKLNPLCPRCFTYHAGEC